MAEAKPIPSIFPSLPEPGHEVAALTEHPASRPRLFPVHGDYMTPTFEPNGFAIVVPVDRYEGSQVYVCDFGIGPALWRAEHWHGQVRCWHTHPRYTPHTVTLDEFNRCVVGLAVAAIDVLDHRILRI
jgi:hypothetical protein